MWRVKQTDMTREACLRRAVELEWLAENSPTRKGWAVSLYEARRWRSLALVARPAAPDEG